MDIFRKSGKNALLFSEGIDKDFIVKLLHDYFDQHGDQLPYRGSRLPYSPKEVREGPNGETILGYQIQHPQLHNSVREVLVASGYSHSTCAPDNPHFNYDSTVVFAICNGIPNVSQVMRDGFAKFIEDKI